VEGKVAYAAGVWGYNTRTRLRSPQNGHLVFNIRIMSKQKNNIVMAKSSRKTNKQLVATKLGHDTSTAAVEPKNKSKKSRKGKARPKLALAGTRAFDIVDGGADVKSYLMSRDNPRDFMSRPVKSPVSYNPVPSQNTTVATTTREGVLTVAAGYSRTLYLWPGHASQDDSVGDDVAFHHAKVNIAGTLFTVGPVDVLEGATHYDSVIGFISPDLLAGNFSAAHNGVGNTPIDYDIDLPFVGKVGTSEHLRWQLISMELVVMNETTKLYRGGSIITAQPNQKTLFDSDTESQGSMNQFPDVIDWGESYAHILFKPQNEDMAMWHTSAAAAQLNTAGLGGMYVFFNGSVSGNQNFRYRIVCNWELAGVHLASISKQKIITPMARNVVEPASTVALNTVGGKANGRVWNIAENIADSKPVAAALHTTAGSVAKFALDAIAAHLGSAAPAV